MSTQHTPGPWVIEAETCHTGDIATVHNTAEKWVTIYAPHWMETGMGEHEQSANARLISAAPDLLGALQELLGCDKTQTSIGAVMRARAAIAKATGGDARCPLCRYEHGHAIGCKNNPVDKAIAAMAKSTGGEV